MNELKVGFSRVNITPMMGITLSGYYVERIADGVLDELEINALAFECKGERALYIAVDNCGMHVDLINAFRAQITKTTGVPAEKIIIGATHTHTAPDMEFDSKTPIIRQYTEFVTLKIADAAKFALDDLKPAKMGYGIGNAPRVAFVRRYIMKDGSIRTNPGVNNPDVVRSLGDPDERVNVVRFDREGAETLIFVNFGNHPDVVGGNKISGDWPTLLRGTVEKVLDNVKCVFANGVQGDVNHVNVFPAGGDLNQMFMDFDDVSRGYNHAQYIARVVCGGVLQTFDKVKYVDVDSIDCREKTMRLPSNRPAPEQMPEAHRIHELHASGRDSELPYEGMMLTTVVAEAERMVNLENGPDAFEIPVSCLRIGDVAMLGIAGEPFTGIGVELKNTEGYALICPLSNTNGYEGYFPMQDAYDEGGYEARSSIFRAGVAERIVEEGKALLRETR